jgi:hypothetical protein
MMLVDEGTLEHLARGPVDPACIEVVPGSGPMKVMLA